MRCLRVDLLLARPSFLSPPSIAVLILLQNYCCIFIPRGCFKDSPLGLRVSDGLLSPQCSKHQIVHLQLEFTASHNLLPPANNITASLITTRVYSDTVFNVICVNEFVVEISTK